MVQHPTQYNDKKQPTTIDRRHRGLLSKGLIVIVTHVDDMAAFVPKETTIKETESAIEEHVELEKLGQPTKLLGMELTWGPNC